MSKNTGNIVFNMLGFQYKPLEAKFLDFCEDNKQLEIIAMYKKANSMLKIRILDNYARFLGL